MGFGSHKGVIPPQNIWGRGQKGETPPKIYGGVPKYGVWRSQRGDPPKKKHTGESLNMGFRVTPPP